MTSKPAQEVKTRLVITDFEDDPMMVSKALGIEATRTWIRGEAVLPIAKNVHRENGWALASPSDPGSTTPEDSIKALLELVPSSESFRNLPVGSQIEVSCAIYSYKHRPFLLLPPDLMARLAAIGATLDLDIYDLSSAPDVGSDKSDLQT